MDSTKFTHSHQETGENGHIPLDLHTEPYHFIVDIGTIEVPSVTGHEAHQMRAGEKDCAACQLASRGSCLLCVSVGSRRGCPRLAHLHLLGLPCPRPSAAVNLFNSQFKEKSRDKDSTGRRNLDEGGAAPSPRCLPDVFSLLSSE